MRFLRAVSFWPDCIGKILGERKARPLLFCKMRSRKFQMNLDKAGVRLKLQRLPWLATLFTRWLEEEPRLQFSETACWPKSWKVARRRLYQPPAIPRQRIFLSWEPKLFLILWQPAF